MSQSGFLLPSYLRALAYLKANQPQLAADEFQKLLEHRGIVLNNPVGALAQIGLARAKAAAGDKPAARKAYQDFLSLWKTADPDIRIFKEAQKEYAKLR